jgi:hypothetical protein
MIISDSQSVWEHPEITVQAFKSDWDLTCYPVMFEYDTHLAYCSREPCRTTACTLRINQPVHLDYDALKRRLRVLTTDGAAAGYLYASDASFLSILYDYTSCAEAINQVWEIEDSSTVIEVQTGPRRDCSELKKLRYPKVKIRVRLRLRQAWPLFTILSVLFIKAADKRIDAILYQNAWLKPLDILRRQFNSMELDTFVLPEQLAAAWMDLTKTACESFR